MVTPDLSIDSPSTVWPKRRWSDHFVDAVILSFAVVQIKRLDGCASVLLWEQGGIGMAVPRRLAARFWYVRLAPAAGHSGKDEPVGYSITFAYARATLLLDTAYVGLSSSVRKRLRFAHSLRWGFGTPK